MELRKIQVTGGSTHVVSLPKKWIDRNGLQRQDTLQIHEEADGSLLVIPNEDAEAKQRRVLLELPSKASEELITRKLVGSYLAGADQIRITCKDGLTRETVDVVHTIIRDLVGVEVHDEDQDSITLQDLVGTHDVDMARTVSRMHRIARIMVDESLDAVQNLNVDLAQRVTARDDELDRIEWMITKQMHALLEQPRLAAKMDLRPAQALNYFLVGRSLERMGDHASKIAKNLRQALDEGTLEETDLVRKRLDDLIQIARQINEAWDDAVTALKRVDFDLANDAVHRGKSLGTWKAKFSEGLGDCGPRTASTLTILADSVDRIRGYTIDIAETAMNHTFQTEKA